MNLHHSTTHVIHISVNFLLGIVFVYWLPKCNLNYTYVPVITLDACTYNHTAHTLLLNVDPKYNACNNISSMGTMSVFT